MSCNHKVFITTNAKQRLGAMLSKYTIERYTKNLDKFEIELIECEKVEEIRKLFGATYLREGKQHLFSADDLQTFTLTRFMPPKLMNYTGRSLVVDPDVFATYSDVWELLGGDMREAAVMSRPGKQQDWATSVMLLDNSKLRHWSIGQIVDDLIGLKLDYRDQMNLRIEKAKIEPLSENWNSFDRLNVQTKLLHNTQRNTQPWRAGLKLDYTPKRMKPIGGVLPREWLHTIVGRNPYRHREHPDPRQTQFFFGHLKSAINNGVIAKEVLDEEISRNHIRPDVINILNKTDPL